MARVPSFFIAGVQRGGTTLLGSLLSAQRDIYTLNDTSLFLVLDNLYREDGNLFTDIVKRGRGVLPEWVVRSVRQLYHRHWGGPDRFSYSPTSLPSPLQEVKRREAEEYLTWVNNHYQKHRVWGSSVGGGCLPTNDGLSVRELICLVMMLLAEQEGKGDETIIGEKTPQHIFYMSYIRYMFPSAKLITVVRNPIATVASIYRRGDLNLPTSLDVYLSFFDRNVRPIYDDPKVKVIRYEDLIYSTEQVLGDLKEFLDMEQDLTSELRPYKKREEYTGALIDESRDAKCMGYWEEPEINYIMTGAAPIIRRFYADIRSLYSGTDVAAILPGIREAYW